jgi:hypothetical protein
MKLTHREQMAVVFALCGDLPDQLSLLGRTVNSAHDRVTYDKHRDETLKMLDRLKEHVLSLEPFK